MEKEGSELLMPDQAVILLAEDREDDIVLIRQAFQKGDIRNPLYVVRNGEEVVAYLNGTGRFFNREEYKFLHAGYSSYRLADLARRARGIE